MQAVAAAKLLGDVVRLVNEWADALQTTEDSRHHFGRAVVQLPEERKSGDILLALLVADLEERGRDVQVNAVGCSTIRRPARRGDKPERMRITEHEAVPVIEYHRGVHAQGGAIHEHARATLAIPDEPDGVLLVGAQRQLAHHGQDAQALEDDAAFRSVAAHVHHLARQVIIADALEQRVVAEVGQEWHVRGRRAPQETAPRGHLVPGALAQHGKLEVQLRVQVPVVLQDGLGIPQLEIVLRAAWRRGPSLLRLLQLEAQPSNFCLQLSDDASLSPVHDRRRLDFLHRLSEGQRDDVVVEELRNGSDRRDDSGHGIAHERLRQKQCQLGVPEVGKRPGSAHGELRDHVREMEQGGVDADHLLVLHSAAHVDGLILPSSQVHERDHAVSPALRGRRRRL
mmetsp:Transcript_13732/g.37120  ORF Transcript_13732/g.37120 Transcript_13732/m.37120 type:complete len:398 (-) Transcript_13732:955-2148(-)